MNKYLLVFFFFFSSYHSFAQQSWIYSNNYTQESLIYNPAYDCNDTLFRVTNDTLEAGFMNFVYQYCSKEY